MFLLHKMNNFFKKTYRIKEGGNGQSREQTRERTKPNPVINSPREMKCNPALEMLLINEWFLKKEEEKKHLWGIKIPREGAKSISSLEDQAEEISQELEQNERG